jgi:hypothetical protein
MVGLLGGEPQSIVWELTDAGISGACLAVRYDPLIR